MPIEMPKGLPFSVDTWSECSKRKRYHFLTHAHKDHSNGITTHFSFPIYSVRLTKTLLLQLFPKLDDSLFVEIEVGQSIIVDDSDDSFTVKAFDANHSPGAVMLFEGKFGYILHTGVAGSPMSVCRIYQRSIWQRKEENRLVNLILFF